MPLSEYEQRVLEHLERDLGSDPKLKSAMTRAPRSASHIDGRGRGRRRGPRRRPHGRDDAGVAPGNRRIRADDRRRLVGLLAPTSTPSRRTPERGARAQEEAASGRLCAASRSASSAAGSRATCSPLGGFRLRRHLVHPCVQLRRARPPAAPARTADPTPRLRAPATAPRARPAGRPLARRISRSTCSIASCGVRLRATARPRSRRGAGTTRASGVVQRPAAARVATPPATTDSEPGDTRRDRPSNAMAADRAALVRPACVAGRRRSAG